MLSAVLILVAAVGSVLALVWLLQRRMIYFPSPEPVPPVATTLPGAEDIGFATPDGLWLRGWFAPSLGTSRGTVLVFNGNAGDRSFRAPLAAALARAGLSVMLFDYRGYGGNPGRPSEHGLALDARAARAYLSARPDVDPSRLVYFGESIGTGVAVTLALEQPPAALVLRSPFTSLEDMGRVHYPFLPTGVLLLDRFDTVGRVGSLTCPVLVLAGERDGIVPAAQSRRVFDAIQTRKRFVLLAGADHNDLDMLIGRRLLDEVDRFLTEVV